MITISAWTSGLGSLVADLGFPKILPERDDGRSTTFLPPIVVKSGAESELQSSARGKLSQRFRRRTLSSETWSLETIGSLENHKIY